MYYSLNSRRTTAYKRVCSSSPSPKPLLLAEQSQPCAKRSRLHSKLSSQAQLSRILSCSIHLTFYVEDRLNNGLLCLKILAIAAALPVLDSPRALDPLQQRQPRRQLSGWLSVWAARLRRSPAVPVSLAALPCFARCALRREKKINSGFFRAVSISPFESEGVAVKGLVLQRVCVSPTQRKSKRILELGSFIRQLRFCPKRGRSLESHLGL